MKRILIASMVAAVVLFVYRVDADAIVIAEVFAKKSAQTPQAVVEACRKRLKEYDDASR